MDPCGRVLPGLAIFYRCDSSSDLFERNVPATSVLKNPNLATAPQNSGIFDGKLSLDFSVRFAQFDGIANLFAFLGRKYPASSAFAS
jgi:hypothetical protein